VSLFSKIKSAGAAYFKLLDDLDARAAEDRRYGRTWKARGRMLGWWLLFSPIAVLLYWHLVTRE